MESPEARRKVVLVGRSIESIVCTCVGLRAKGKGMWSEGAGPRRSRVPLAIGKSDFRARRDETCSRFAKKENKKQKKTGVVRLLMCGDTCRQGRETAPGGGKIVPEVTLCRQSPRVRFLFRRRPATGRRAWWNRLSFLGKCSSAAYLGRPVQVCGKTHNSIIESHWQSFTMDANGGVHPAGKSRSRERQSDHCEHYLLPCVFIVIIYWFICRHAFSLTSSWLSRGIIIRKLKSGFFTGGRNVIINGNLTNGHFDDWISL